MLRTAVFVTTLKTPFAPVWPLLNSSSSRATGFGHKASRSMHCRVWSCQAKRLRKPNSKPPF